MFPEIALSVIHVSGWMCESLIEMQNWESFWMLKRNRAQKYGNNQIKFVFKGFCRVRMMVSRMGGKGLVDLEQNQT